MKKTIQLTAIENLISTYYITPYFNTLLNIPLSFKKKKFKITSNIKNISTNNPQYITKLSYPNPSILKIILCTNTVNKNNTPFIAANKILFIFHYLFPFLNQ